LCMQWLFMNHSRIIHIPNPTVLCMAGLWVGRAGPLPRAPTSRWRQKSGVRPATR
jgi:hypothetical protein